MANRVVSVSRQSWMGRMGGAVMGIVAGLVLVPLSMGILFWNEGRSVKTYRSLKEGSGQVRSVAADRVAPDSQGKLVHVTGMATTDETLSDPETGVSARAIRLKRNVEMYQWKESTRSETRHKTGGSTETVKTYEYSRVWEDDPIRSESFAEQSGHANPGTWRYEERTYEALVTLGAFTLSEALAKQIGPSRPLPLTDVPAQLAAGPPATLHDGKAYLGADPARPEVGDLRIGYDVVEPGAVSVVAGQEGTTLSPFQTQAGGSIALLEGGTRAAQEMFQAAQTRNTFLAWVLRFAGFLLMAVGMALLLRPVRVMADVLPFLGRVVGLASGLVSVLAAGALASVTIAFAWLFHRPLLGVSLFVLAGGLLVSTLILVVRRRAASPAG